MKVAESKTYAGLRYVDLLAPLREELTTYRARCGAPQGDELVFATAGTNPDRLTPHSLRRTFASLLLANGDELPLRHEQLGHADPKMTLGVYAQVMQRKDGEQERLRALANGAEWAPSGTGADSGPSEAASRELPIRSRIAASGA